MLGVKDSGISNQAQLDSALERANEICSNQEWGGDKQEVQKLQREMITLYQSLSRWQDSPDNQFSNQLEQVREVVNKLDISIQGATRQLTEDFQWS